MSNDVGTNTLFHALLKALIAGLPNLPSTVTAVSVKGQTFTPAALVTQLSTLEAPYAAAVKADQAKSDADAAVEAVDKEARRFTMNVVAALKVAVGNTSPSLKNLGIEPDKVPQPPTGPKKVERAQKGQATRKARGTLGTRQRAKIHGEVPAAAPTAAPTAAPGPTKTGS